jgi:hypothetical protein
VVFLNSPLLMIQRNGQKYNKTKEVWRTCDLREESSAGCAVSRKSLVRTWPRIYTLKCRAFAWCFSARASRRIPLISSSLFMTPVLLIHLRLHHLRDVAIHAIIGISDTVCSIDVCEGSAVPILQCRLLLLLLQLVVCRWTPHTAPAAPP